MADYKQLCADLVAWAEKTSAHYYSEPGVLIRARAALAEPEPEGPTDLQPIPVSERMPGPEDCNSEEKAMRQQQQQEEES